MEKSAPLIPYVSKALFIGSSGYLDPSKVLLGAKKDVIAVRKFFKNHMNIFDDPT